MQNAADSGVSALPKHHGDSFASIASELAALLDRVQGSIKAIEATRRPRVRNMSTMLSCWTMSHPAMRRQARR